jgi:DNA-binding NarL/FixJ family response regulator
MEDAGRMGSARKDFKPASRKKRSGHRQSTAERPRIVIADDDPLILDQIAMLLETHFEVVARVGNGRELVDAVRRVAPAVAVVDIAMPQMNGIEAAKSITSTYPDVKVVMLSGYSEDALVEAAFNAGASGYVLKLNAFTELVPAIQNVLAGKLYSPPEAGSK